MPPSEIRVIQDFLSTRASLRPEGPAVVDGDLRLSNRQLQERVDAVAKALLRAGIAKGDRVGTLAPPSADFWILYLASTSIGAIWHGLNPKYQHKEYAYLLGDARPSVVFVRSPFDGRDYLEELQRLAPGEMRFVRLGDSALDANHPFVSEGSGVSAAKLQDARAAVDPEDIAVIVYTSGTTGQPKGAMLSHRAIVRSALANIEWIGDGLDSALCPAPINHVGALNNDCMTVFAGGGCIIFLPRVDFELIGATSARERPTYLVASPTSIAMMLAIPDFSFESYQHYKVIVFGGAATPLGHIKELQKTGARLSSVFGQTETCGTITYTAFDAPLDVVAETIGRPIRDVSVRVATPDGAPLAEGEIGEIQVLGPPVMSGYFNRPEATREAFTADGWLKTGDLGVTRPDGNISFSGRLKEMFKSGGYNIYPVEIELAICEHPDVAQAAVVSLPHEIYQEVGHAFLVAHPGHKIDTEDVKAFLRERIANYKIPKTWAVLPDFPVLPIGKVDKKALRASLDS